MYTKHHLITDVLAYTPDDAQEEAHKVALLALLNGTDHCFERHHFPGHVTGSALLLSPDNQQTLMTHHKALNKWLQFGGHADGDIHIRNVALREAQEESGILAIEYLKPEIFDIDVHPIPASEKRNEPAHYHYDIRYLLRATTLTYAISDESNTLQWFTPEQVDALQPQESILRMVRKWRQYLSDLAA